MRESGVGGQGVEGEGSDEEVDQFDASDDSMQAAALPSETGALFDESRVSSPEAHLTTGRSAATTNAIDVTTHDLIHPSLTLPGTCLLLHYDKRLSSQP